MMTTVPDSPDTENSSEKEPLLDRLLQLRDRILSMHPEDCGHEHEVWINDQLAVIGSRPVLESEISFCSDEFRNNNPACAHCFRKNGRERLEQLLPFLGSAIDAYVGKYNGPPQLANPFLLELEYAISLHVPFSTEDVDSLITNSITALDRASLDTYRIDSAYAVFLDHTRSNLRVLKEQGGYPPSQLRDYEIILRGMIHYLDTRTQLSANKGHYNKENVRKKQKYTISLLNEFKSTLLTAIDRGINQAKESDQELP